MYLEWSGICLGHRTDCTRTRYLSLHFELTTMELQSPVLDSVPDHEKILMIKVVSTWNLRVLVLKGAAEKWDSTSAQPHVYTQQTYLLKSKKENSFHDFLAQAAGHVQRSKQITGES